MDTLPDRLDIIEDETYPEDNLPDYKRPGDLVLLQEAKQYAQMRREERVKEYYEKIL